MYIERRAFEKRRNKWISFRAIIAFIITFILCLVLVTATVLNRSDVEELTMESLILEKSIKINDAISRLLYKTQMLSALVLQGNGEVENFERVAEAIIDDPAILNIILAPSGVVSYVYPLEGNEAVVGLDYFEEGAGNKEAIMAKELGQLVFGGPFNAVQGGRVLVGRFPVYIHTNEKNEFWGLVSVTLKFPDALRDAVLEDIERDGLAYEIWRVNPDNNERQIIAQSNKSNLNNKHYSEKHIQILNADWYIRIAPIHNWYEYPETWILSFIGLCVSFLVALVTQNNVQLKQIQLKLESEMNEAAILAEELAVSKEQADVANKAKSAFLANMSHEIRTPMNGIIGFSELALDEELPEAARTYINEIQNSSVRLLEIINDILDISKVEAGKMYLEHIPFRIYEVFESCKTICARAAMEKGLIFNFHIDPTAEKTLLGDPTKLHQILLNLLSNSIKFTNTGIVKFMVVTRRSEKDSLEVGFEVQDSGIGMEPHQIRKIFDPFEQSDSTVARKFGGTGLGLSITKKLIELMGGQLEVESMPGVGSKFSFTVTFETAPEQAGIDSGNAISADKAERPMFKGEVLVFEDDEVSQQVIRLHLLKVGLNTKIASTGTEGLLLAGERMANGMPFDLILMDIHLPDMNGLDVVGRLIETGSKTPVVALTANIMENDTEIYKVHGISDCLGKPFRANELWTCLRKYLQPVLEFSHEDAPEQYSDNPIL